MPNALFLLGIFLFCFFYKDGEFRSSVHVAEAPERHGRGPPSPPPGSRRRRGPILRRATHAPGRGATVGPNQTVWRPLVRFLAAPKHPKRGAARRGPGRAS